MDFQTTVKEVGPVDLKRRLDAGENVILLDVREPSELAICSLVYTANVPLGQQHLRLSELDEYKNKEVVVYCRSGKRSGRACQFILDNGFKHVVNLKGGILAWADEVDPTLTKY